MGRYTFGDDRSAGDRLLLVARAYEPVSRVFLDRHAPRDGRMALDLGCGPGFSTHLVGDVCHPRSLVGIDASRAFVESARIRFPAIRFVTADVTADPLPGAPADLIYARLLLAHLTDPVALLEGWKGALSPGGVLLIEDLDSVVNAPGPLQEYEAVSSLIVRAGGGPMYAGALLAGLGGEIRPVTVPGSVAAEIYLFNVRRWRQVPGVPVTDGRLKALEAGLIEIAAHDGGTEVSWVVRQLAITS